MSGSAALLPAGLETLNVLPANQAEAELAACCAARAWSSG